MSSLSLSGQKMRNLSQERAWCVVADAHGTFCYEVFADHLFSASFQGSEMRESTRKSRGQQTAGWETRVLRPSFVTAARKRGTSCIFLFGGCNPTIEEGRHVHIALTNHLAAGRTLLPEEPALRSWSAVPGGLLGTNPDWVRQVRLMGAFEDVLSKSK